MAQCPRCGKKGLFLRLTDYNLCEGCTSWTLAHKTIQKPAPSTPMQRHSSVSRSAENWKVQLQNITCNMNRSNLVISDSQLQASATMYIENRLRIVKDCISILNSTKNPDTFYNRRDLLLKNLDELCEIERIRPQLFTKNVSSQANTIRAEMSKNEAAMIKRAYAKAEEDAEKVKSAQSRQNKYTTFFETMHDYQDRLAPENRELLQRLIAEAGMTSFYSSETKVSDEPYNYDALIALQDEYASLFRQHDKLTEQIGTAYTIANELKTPDSPEMDHVIALCKEDIALAPQIREYWEKRDDIFKNEESSIPKNYSTFSRLAIIYEKRKEYQNAIDVCSQAVKLGFTSDRTEGGMIGRAARLTRKLNQENARISSPEPAVVVESPNAPDGAVTTSTELECFAIIKTLLHDVIDISRISYKDTKSYFSVIVDGKTTKWVCRLRVEGKTKTITIPDETGQEIRHIITSGDDIINYKDELIGRIARINQ